MTTTVAFLLEWYKNFYFCSKQNKIFFLVDLFKERIEKNKIKTFLVKMGIILKVEKAI